MGYQSAKRSSTDTRSSLHPLKEGCKVVLITALVGVLKDKYFFPKPRDLWYMLQVRKVQKTAY